MDNCTPHHLEPVGRKNDDEVWMGVAMEGDQAGKMRGRGGLEGSQAEGEGWAVT